MGTTVPRKLSEAQAATMAEFADIDGPLVDSKQKGHVVEFIGKEDVEETKAYHLKVTKQGGQTMDIYLDAERYVEMKRIDKRVVEGVQIEVTTYYQDYRLVEDMLMPYSVRVEAPERPAFNQVIKLEKIHINPEMSDAVFQMPAQNVNHQGNSPTSVTRVIPPS